MLFYLLTETTIFLGWFKDFQKNCPQYWIWKRRALELCCLKGALKNVTVLNETAAKWLTHFSRSINSICWKTYIFVLSISEWLRCLQRNPLLCRCLFNVNENVHDTHTQPLYKMPSQVCTSISQVSGLYSVPHYWMSVTAKVLHTCSNMFPSWL